MKQVQKFELCGYYITSNDDPSLDSQESILKTLRKKALGLGQDSWMFEGAKFS